MIYKIYKNDLLEQINTNEQIKVITACKCQR